jgi:hypothetical protein
MPEQLQFKKLARENVQHCPLCGMPQEGIVNGMQYTYKPTGELDDIKIHEDKWFSFCNCRNIFFTPWENMEQDVYNEEYTVRFQGLDKDRSFNLAMKESFDSFPISKGTFIEVGVVHDYILDYAKEKGFNPVAVDINPDLKSKYPKFIGTIEDPVLVEILPPADLIWASHLIEHCHYPIETCKMMFDKLNTGGIFYVIMPDPWLITWEHPHQWGHWHHREHHIMWDMDSFIDAMIEIGFELVNAKRRILKTDYAIVFRKPL